MPIFLPNAKTVHSAIGKGIHFDLDVQNRLARLAIHTVRPPSRGAARAIAWPAVSTEIVENNLLVGMVSPGRLFGTPLSDVEVVRVNAVTCVAALVVFEELNLEDSETLRKRVLVRDAVHNVLTNEWFDVALICVRIVRGASGAFALVPVTATKGQQICASFVAASMCAGSAFIDVIRKADRH